MKYFLTLLFAMSCLSALSSQEIQTTLRKFPLTLYPNRTCSIRLRTSDVDFPTKKLLRVVGGTKIPVPYVARGETFFRAWEGLLDDSLDYKNRKKDKCSLLFEGDGKNIPQLAFSRVVSDSFSTGEIKLGAWIKLEDFQVASEEPFGITVELFKKKEGRNPLDIYDSPDETVFFPIEEGSRDFFWFEESFQLPKDTAAIVLKMGGSEFSGRCWIESPSLSQNGTVIKKPYKEWVGMNFVTRNWPVWKVKINKQEIFCEPVFDRSSYIADFYIPLPENVKENDLISLTLVKDKYKKNFPYRIRRIELIEVPARTFEVISPLDYLPSNQEFGLLIEINQPNLIFSIKTSDSIQFLKKEGEEESTFKEKGFHVLPFKTLDQTDFNPFIEISDGIERYHLDDFLVIQKKADGVYLSTGDEVYVDRKEPDYHHYFRWFIQDGLGNFYHFRPSYQWSGARESNDTFLNKYLPLLQQLKMPYAWQVEGRTLAGFNINPPLEKLESPFFMGKQAHENDGGYYYWSHFKHNGLYGDIAARYRPYGGIFAKQRPLYTDKGTFVFYSPHSVQSMEDGAKQFVENLRYSKGESSRHTGPTTLFRYFYQAGYDWLGAEQMYGPEEILLASLRGASRAYGKKDYGTLHAMQWGSGPYTAQEHWDRFYLSLATAYMNGASHINTEEALYVDEYCNDRFSPSGKAHILQQKKILEYIKTHERRGEQVNDIGVIQGRNDSWNCFVRSPHWNQAGGRWRWDRVNRSFDLLNLFYPDCVVAAGGPHRWFSSTPYGSIDLVPIEAPLEALKRYKTLSFLGWNSYNQEDFNRLVQFVEDGGTLILSDVHLEGQPFPFKKELEKMNFVNGKNLIPYGKGQVIFFKGGFYPAEIAIRGEYEGALRDQAVFHNREQFKRGWISDNSKTSFSVWDSGDLRTIYLLNIDWRSKTPECEATLRLGEAQFKLSARKNEMETIYCFQGMGIQPFNRTTDILSFDENKVILQTTAPETVKLFVEKTGETEVIQLGSAGIHEIFFEE